MFSRYILTPTKFNCTLGHAQILGQTPKKTRNFFLQWDFYDEIPYPETRFDTDFAQISGPNLILSRYLFKPLIENEMRMYCLLKRLFSPSVFGICG